MASIRSSAGRPAEAERAYRDAVATYEDHPTAREALSDCYRNLGLLLARTGRLEDGEIALRRALDLKPASVSYSPLCHLATVQLARGDVGGYRRSCATLLSRFGQDDRPDALNSVAAFCLLIPDAGLDPADLVRVGRKAVERGRGEPPMKRRDYLTTLGVALYRAGRYGESIARLEESMKLHPSGGDPDDWRFLAMAHDRLGHADEARRWYDRSVRWDEQYRAWLQRDRLQAEEQRRYRAEVEELLKVQAGD